jgi:hypothetical protein
MPIITINYPKEAAGVPYIKQKEESRIKLFLSTRWGEALTAAVLGGIFHAFISDLFVKLSVFASETLYPFTYPFFHAPLHSWIPETILNSHIIYQLIFSSGFALLIYYFEKNIFYRRFHLGLKTAFAAIAACVAVFVVGLFSYVLPIPEIYSAELPGLFIYNYLTLLPLFLFCDCIRRSIFALP